MKKRILSMMLCCVMVIGLYPNMAFAASEERTIVLTDRVSNASCASLTGQMKETSIDTVPFIGTESTDIHPLYIAENGVTLTVAEELVDSEYRYEYTARLTRRDFADDGSVDWTHLEEYEGTPQIITAADGAVALTDGAYCLEIECQQIPQIAMAGSSTSYTPARVFLRVGSGMNIANPFSDVPANSYFFTPVLWAVHRGITNGTSVTTFSPDEICNRGQIVTFLYRAFYQA